MELKTRITELAALQKRLRNLQRKDTVSIDAVNAWFSDQVKTFKERLLEIPKELANELALEKSPRKIRSRINGRIRKVCREVKKMGKQD